MSTFLPKDPRLKHLNIAGMMAINRFPMAVSMIGRMSFYIDVLILRLDTLNGSELLFTDTQEMFTREKRIRVFKGVSKWDRHTWRDELLQETLGYYFNNSSDTNGPDILLTPDEDECFEPNAIVQDILDFSESESYFALFDYNMVLCPSEPGHTKAPKYPRSKHCKMFKYVPGMSYSSPNYRGCALPNHGNKQIKNSTFFEARSKIQHYCYYKKEWMRTHKHHN